MQEVKLREEGASVFGENGGSQSNINEQSQSPPSSQPAPQPKSKTEESFGDGNSQQSPQPLFNEEAHTVSSFSGPSLSENQPGPVVNLSDASSGGNNAGSSASNFNNGVNNQAMASQNQPLQSQQPPQSPDFTGGTTNPKPQKSKSGLKKALLFSGIFLLAVGLLVGAAWGAMFYEKNFKEVAIEEVLPGDVNVALKINTDIEANQYQLLNENLKKFPGYDLLKKDLDEAGEGKSPAEFIQEKLQEANLDYQSDIKEVLKNEAYVLIPNIEVVSRNIQKKVVRIKESFPGITNQSSPRGPGLGGGLSEKTLAQAEDYYFPNPGSGSAEDEELEPMDFVMGSRIKNLEKAKEVIEKLKAKTDDDIEVKEKEYLGYTYVKVSTPQDEDEKLSFLNTQNTYHAVLGGNWIMATKEDYIKESIEYRQSKNKFDFNSLNPLAEELDLLTEGKQSLGEDQKFQAAMSEVLGEEEEYLISVYFNIDLERLMSSLEPGSSLPKPGGYNPPDYFNHPTEMIGSFVIRVEQDGIVIRQLASNQIIADSVSNYPFKEGTVEILPSRLNGKFADVYFSYANIKELYYSIKKNYLTDEGRDKLNEIRNEAAATIKFDFETDLIDQFNGELAGVMYTKSQEAPEGALLVEVEDKERMVQVFSNLIEVGKAVYLEQSQSGLDRVKMMCSSSSSAPNNGLYSRQSFYSPESCDQMIAKQQKMIDLITNTRLQETETALGKIYSYKLPLKDMSEGMLPFDFSFDFGFWEGKMILASNYATVGKLMEEFSSDKEEKLVQNENFQKAVQRLGVNEGYSKGYIRPYGLWNVVEYVYYESQRHYEQQATVAEESEENSLSGSMTPVSPLEAALTPSAQEMEEQALAISKIFKTLNAVTGVNTIVREGEYVKGTTFFEIKELPADEKEEAEEILKNM